MLESVLRFTIALLLLAPSLSAASTTKASPAGQINVTIARNGGEAVPLDVAIGLHHGDRGADWIAHRRIAATESSTRFTSLGKGVYDLLVSGPEPLQRIAARVMLGDGDHRTVTVPIAWSFVRVRAKVGEQPLVHARIRVVEPQAHWSTMLTTDDRGEASSAAWTVGRFSVAVDGGGLATSWLARMTLSDQPAQTVDLSIPDRRITGRITDAAGHPAPAAEVILRSAGHDIAPTVRTRSGADGRFAFSGVRAGSQLLLVNPRELLRPDPLRFEVGEEERTHPIEIVARGGHPLPFTIRDRHEAPLPGALIVAATPTGRVRARAYSDPRGEGLLLVPDGERAVAWVFPSDGSLAVAQIDPAAEALHVVVPAATSTLRVATLTSDDMPIAELSLLLRVNGEMISPEVADEWQAQRRGSLVTDEEGRVVVSALPSGLYELWPYRTELEADLLQQSSPAAAASLTVVPGDNEVTLRFRRKH